MQIESSTTRKTITSFSRTIIGKTGIPLTTEQGKEMLERLQHWPHWDYIGMVARKEYHLDPERFQEFLPEYQKFLCLIVLGVKGLGMFDATIDNIWHSHILATLRYQQFCEVFNEGEIIHHLPQLDAKRMNICTVCKSCAGCSTPHDCDNALVPDEASGDPNYFAQAYFQVFGSAPSSHWNLKRFQAVIKPEYIR